MSLLRTTLRLLAPAFFVVACLHLTLGLGADVLLGAKLPESALSDPSLDSQNRFYGTSLALYGALLWVASRDIVRHALVLRCTLAAFFAAGLARIVSIALHGWPSTPVLVLFATEILAPPVLWIWLSRVLRAERPPTPAP